MTAGPTDPSLRASPCPVCAEPLRFLAPCGDQFSYYKRKACTHTTALPLPSEAELAVFYDGFLFNQPSEHARIVHESRIDRDVARILQNIQRIGGMSTPVRVLDWGGGTGFYANAFAKAGNDCTLIDIDPQACDYAKRNFGHVLSAVIADDPRSHAFNERFDVVFCNQVIEHCTDVATLLRSLERALVPGGLLIVTTPNQQCKEFWFRHAWWLRYVRRGARSRLGIPLAAARFVRSPWICCDPPRHLHAFNRRSLTALIAGTSRLQTLAIFGEYSDRQYHSPSMRHVDFRLRRLRSLFRVVYGCVNAGGIRLLHALAPDGRWGNNLVLYARIDAR